MSPKSVVSRARFMLVAALAISAVALGGCAETTSSGEPVSPAYTRVAGSGYRLNPSIVEAHNDTGARPSFNVAQRPAVGHSDRYSRTASR
jgi:hypothetical protein